MDAPFRPPPRGGLPQRRACYAAVPSGDSPMRPNSAAARDVRNLLHGYVHLSKHRQSGPAVITGGKGIFVHDENGTPYLEAASGMWCTSMGFGEEALVEAAAEQMRKLPYYHTIASKSVNPAIDLAEKLTAMVPIRNAR